MERWYSIGASELDKSPRWKSSDESPPLPPRKAVEVSNNALAEFERTGLLPKRHEGLEWKIKKVALTSVTEDKWIYEVMYQESVKPGHGATGRRPSLTVVVLMDGTYVTPSSQINSTLEK